MAKTNRYWINPVVRRVAGRIPPLILIHHLGRTSGKPYNTPVWAFRHGTGFIIALTYGPRTDWLRNFEAAGSCKADYRSRSYTLTDPRLVHGDPRTQPLPWIVRQALVVLGVSDFLLADARIME
jgi:deazaflavin-dependent oxidoreductase (nitroreductase family)